MARNTRREFIRRSVASGTLMAGGVWKTARAAEQGQKNSAPSGGAYDIVVAGGGTAGAIAAIQAGRLGMRTLLIEKNGMPGGTTTSAAVNFPGLFHAWGRQVIAGIGWELVSKAVALCGERLPDFSHAPVHHWQQQVRVNRAVYTALLCEALQQAGVETWFHTMPAEAEERPEGISLTVCTKTGLETVRTRAAIDATGDATVLTLAGYRVIEGTVCQPGTLMFTLTGYRFESLDMDAIQRAFEDAVASGELTAVDKVFVRNSIRGFLSNRGDNCTHITHIDGRTSAGRSAAEMTSRVSLLRVFRFLRGQPGLGGLEIAFMAPECGIRETVRIVGEAQIMHDDYVTGRVWEDAVCYSFYPIDLHQAAGGGVDTRPLTPGVVATVPRGALVPQGSRRLLVAGRSLSSDREANSALRVQATCMACGQAAAVLAARAIREDTTVMLADMRAVRATLREHNAIVPDAQG